MRYGCVHIAAGSRIESSYYLFWFASVVAAVMHCSIATHTPHPPITPWITHVRFYHFCRIDRTPSRDMRCMTLYPPMAWQLAPLILYINFCCIFLFHLSTFTVQTHPSRPVLLFFTVIVIIIINIKDWTFWSVPSPELQTVIADLNSCDSTA